MAVSEVYPEKYKSGILISKEEWKEMIPDGSIFRESDIHFLSKMYMEKNHASTCSELALKDGVSPQSYNSPMVTLAKKSPLSSWKETRAG